MTQQQFIDEFSRDGYKAVPLPQELDLLSEEDLVTLLGKVHSVFTELGADLIRVSHLPQDRLNRAITARLKRTRCWYLSLRGKVQAAISRKQHKARAESRQDVMALDAIAFVEAAKRTLPRDVYIAVWGAVNEQKHS
jgi:hypothetical protein